MATNYKMNTKSEIIREEKKFINFKGKKKKRFSKVNSGR